MDPSLLAVCLAMSAVGCALGLFSGLVPGIHVNTLAAMLLTAYPALETALPQWMEGVRKAWAERRA